MNSSQNLEQVNQVGQVFAQKLQCNCCHDFKLKDIYINCDI